MKLLAVDTATEACSVALWQDGETLERWEHVGQAHSARLPSMVAELLGEAGITIRQLDGLVCGIGPGSFAGVRVGVGYIKGLALGLQCPAAGVSSLAMLAQYAIRVHGAQRVLCAIDARMREIYFGAFYNREGRACIEGEERVCAPAQVPAPAVGDWVGVGSGWQAYDAVLRAALGVPPERVDAQALPHALDALTLALPDFSSGRTVDAAQIAPRYLRNRVALTVDEQKAARSASH